MMFTVSNKQNRSSNSIRQAGFTLIEVMVVVVILGILAAVIVPKIMDNPDKARIVKARSDVQALRGALDLYKLETGRYPTSGEGLQALVAAPAGASNWNGPYWKKTQIPKDPWGNEYRYTSPGQKGAYDIVSLGADGKEGGDGANKDITSAD